MPTVKFTQALKRFYPELAVFETAHKDLYSILDYLEEQHPGLRTYIIDDQRRLRKHVNIYLDGEMVMDRDALSDSLENVKEVYFMQALSGG